MPIPAASAKNIPSPLEKLKNLSFIQQDTNLDSSPDNYINESILKSGLISAAQVIQESLRVTDLTGVNIFRTPAMRLAQMQFFADQELNAIRHRLTIENYSSFIYDLKKMNNLSVKQLNSLLAKDLI